MTTRVQFTALLAIAAAISAGDTRPALAGYSTAISSLSGLEHYWRLNESGSPATAADSVNGKTGTYTSGDRPGAVELGNPSPSSPGDPTAGPRPADGFLGFSNGNLAANFESSQKDGLFMNAPDALGTGGAMFSNEDVDQLSMIVWFKSDALDNHGLIGGYATNTASGRYKLAIEHRPSGDVRVRVSTHETTSGSPLGGSVTSAITIPEIGNSNTSGWHMLTATYDGSGSGGGTLLLYMDDNSPVGETGSTQTAKGAIFTPDELLFGRDATNERFFNGALDEIAIFSRVLSSQEIDGIYDAAVTVPEPNSIALSLLSIGLAAFGRRRMRRGRA